MTVRFVAVHYPEPAHLEEFVARVRQVGEVLRSTPGCLSAEHWATDDGDAVLSTGHFESDEAFAAGFAAVRASGADIAFDQRERRPRQVFKRSS